MSVKTNYIEIQPKLEEGVEEGREKLLYRLQKKPYHKHFCCLVKKTTISWNLDTCSNTLFKEIGSWEDSPNERLTTWFWKEK